MNPNPHQIAEERINLSEEYSRLSDIYAGLIKTQADFYLVHREQFKSDTATERAFDRTADGVEMAKINMRLKAIDKLMSAKSTYLRLMENEAKGHY